MIIKHLILTVFACLFLRVCTCGQAKTRHSHNSIEKAKRDLINKLNDYDNLPARYKTTKEQWKNTNYDKIYGSNKLKQISPFIYSYTDDENNVELRSEVENIVLVIDRKTNNGSKIAFYSQNELIKLVLIDTLNPYKKLSNTAVDLSHLEDKLMSNRFKDKESIDKKIAYAATQWTHYSSQNKYITIAFSLEHRNKDGIPIKWEESLFVFNQDANIVFKTQVNNDVTDFYLSENLQYYGYTFGGLNSEDFKAGKTAIFRLHEFDSQKQIFQSNTEYSLSGFYELVPNVVQLNIESNQKDNLSYWVLDLESKSILSLFEDYNEERKFIQNSNRDMIDYLKKSKLTNLKFIENEK